LVIQRRFMLALPFKAVQAVLTSPHSQESGKDPFEALTG
jgi:hypothetical protein